MNEILCSTGAIVGRLNNRNYKIILECADKIHCDGFEFMMFKCWYDILDELTENLCKSKISFPSMHCEKQIGEFITNGDLDTAYYYFDVNCKVAKKLGTSILVLHLWNGVVSDSHFENNLKSYRTFYEIANDYNLTLTVENVVCNTSNPMDRLKTLYENYPEISFTFDTKMASFHCELDDFYDKEYSWLANQTRHIHINDYNGGYMDWPNLKSLHLGDGSIDFDNFFNYLKLLNYDGMFTIEATSINDDGSIDVDSLNKTINIARKYLK